MSRTLKIAAVQMDHAPAPLDSRLARAADLIAEAAGSGAQLVVLPEVFNTGYKYHDANYTAAETSDGPTVRWMKAQSTQHGLHLAGSLLLRDGQEIYNSLLLVAPDGRTWRYDKNYPWAWERAYFREGRGTVIADTDLGKLGLMICWDYAHRDLWRQYAGRVDALVIASSPPRAEDLTLVLPDGTRISPAEVSRMATTVRDTDMPFGQDLDALVAWLGVPAVNTVQTGHFRSHIPGAAFTVGGLATLMRPDMLGAVLKAPGEIEMETDFYLQAKIIDANGQPVARVTEPGDGLTLAEVELADTPPQPRASLPRSSMTFPIYFISDWFVPNATVLLYRRKLRQYFGPHMAPVDQRTRITAAGLGAAAVVGGFVGWLLGRRR